MNAFERINYINHGIVEAIYKNVQHAFRELYKSIAWARMVEIQQQDWYHKHNTTSYGRKRGKGKR